MPEDAIRLDRLELAVPEVQTNAPLRHGAGSGRVPYDMCHIIEKLNWSATRKAIRYRGSGI